MTYKEAAATLGLHYVSVHRLRRSGKLKAVPGGLDEKSVHAYLRRMRKPEGYVDGTVAADRLLIPRREMTGVAAAGLVEAIARPGGGWWVSEKDVEALAGTPEKLAALGMKVPPPDGWLTAVTASLRLGCSRSWLSRLARRGLIRRRLFGTVNAWYHEGDVADYLRNNQPASA